MAPSLGDIPEEINQAYIGDLHRISEAFAAPLANFFHFREEWTPSVPFTTQKQLALHASPRFWQYGLLPSSRGAVPLTINTDQGTGTAQAVAVKPQKRKEKDVDALTFM